VQYSASLHALCLQFSFLYFFFYSSRDHRDLHSFPTRRSSDLTENIINGVERPVKAAELFAFTLRVRAGNTDVLTDAEENVSVSCAYTDRKSGSAGMPRPISYAVFCLKKKKKKKSKRTHIATIQHKLKKIV